MGRCIVAVRSRPWKLLLSVVALTIMLGVVSAPGASARTHRISARSAGALDCNGNSPVQKTMKRTGACTDVRGLTRGNSRFTDDGRFYDNGKYIGHDEPDMTFLSSRPGSGNDVTWNETLPREPAAAPTADHPGSDVAHTFELSIAPWFSMALCNAKSFPLRDCSPRSDKNAPDCIGIKCSPKSFPGGGSSFTEVQFYPPGFAPFVDGASCDNAHWCASLHINDLECRLNGECNPNCIEPTNFAFIQTNGVPTGPPSPQQANLSTNTPNDHTLLMSPGDRLTVHMFDADVPGHPGHKALEVFIKDLTTGKTGFMQASAANGYAATSPTDCSGTPFDYQPEYNTAARNNITPWAALQTDISTQFEIGHFEACSRVSDPFTIGLAPEITDVVWQNCHGAYEATAPPDGSNNPEVGDSPCYPKGDTHGALHSAPDTVTGCLQFFTQNGDLDFDGSSYWPEWPTGVDPTQKLPGSFVQALPTSGGGQYAQYFIQTDAALSESTCTDKGGCAVPPPNAPGKFYPYWSRVSSGGVCKIEFGNVGSGPGVNNLGKFAQYGDNSGFAKYGYPELIGPIRKNTSC